MADNKYNSWCEICDIFVQNMVHFSSQMDRHLSTKYMQFIALGNILVCTFTLHTSDNNPDCRVGQFSTRSWVRNQAAPEVRVRKTDQKYSGAPAQVLHEKVERAERVEGHLPHLVHMRIDTAY
jgi:hypothetical protein